MVLRRDWCARTTIPLDCRRLGQVACADGATPTGTYVAASPFGKTQFKAPDTLEVIILHVLIATTVSRYLPVLYWSIWSILPGKTGKTGKIVAPLEW